MAEDRPPDDQQNDDQQNDDPQIDDPQIDDQQIDDPQIDDPQIDDEQVEDEGLVDEIGSDLRRPDDAPDGSAPEEAAEDEIADPTDRSVPADPPPADPPSDEPDADTEPDTNDDLADDDLDLEERVTEIGAPEQIDRQEHPLAVGLGMGALVLLLFIGIVAFGSSFSKNDTSAEVAQVVLPRMAGRNLTEAQGELEQLGLIVDVAYDSNEVVPVDVVIDQEPIAGSRIEVGEQVTLRVSDGLAGIDVPDMSGLQGGEAVKLLEAVGLVATLENTYDETIRPGEVVGADPASGTRAPPGSTVVVKVSQGPAPRTVPTIAGLTIGQAVVALARADLTVGTVTEQFTMDQPGIVVSSDPVGGAQAPRDQPVALVVTSNLLPVEVPDLVGLTRASAATVAKNLGLTTSVTTQSLVAGDLRIGLVISQAPVAGSRVVSGGSVRVTVGALAAPTTTTTTTIPGAVTTTTVKR